MEIICYSCGRGEKPENTIEGIRHCQSVNPEWRIEMDVQITSDKKLVLFHDYNTRRTTGEEKLINELSLKELRMLNAGYNFESHGGFIYRSTPIRVPELKTVFETFPEAKFLLDIHTNDIEVVELLIELINLKFSRGDFVIASEYDVIINELKRKQPDWIYGVAEKEAKKLLYSSFILLDSLFPIKSDILMLPKQYGKINVLSKRIINHAKNRNKKIWAWLYEGDVVKTVSSKKEMDELRIIGVDGIFTGFPSRLFSELH